MTIHLFFCDKIHEPERLKTPAVDSSSWLTNPITGTAYTVSIIAKF